MKYTFVTVAALFASALAAPTMVNERQMKAIEILYNNKYALGFSQDELNTFEEAMNSLHKRDTVADAPAGAAPAGAGPGGLGGLTGSLGGLTGGAKGGKRGGGLLGGILIPGIL